jgi:hypothetical protein
MYVRQDTHCCCASAGVTAVTTGGIIALLSTPSLAGIQHASDASLQCICASSSLTQLLCCASSQALSHGLMHTRHSQQLQLQAAAGGACTAATAGAMLAGVCLLDQVDVPAGQRQRRPSPQQNE